MAFNQTLAIPNVAGSAFLPSNTTPPVTIANLATGGNIGTASATVDNNTIFVHTQTTVGQTITLPNPTTPTAGKVVVYHLASASTASVAFYGITVSAGHTIFMLWNGASWSIDSRALVANDIASPYTTTPPIAITDKPTGGVIGTALVTVDIHSAFNVNQTTANQTLTLPAPTATAPARVAVVSNVGTASFLLYGNNIASGAGVILEWNGTTWISVGGGGGGSDTIQSMSATGAVTAWGSIVQYGGTTPTANGILTLPAVTAGDVGKKITFVRLDNTAFTLGVAPTGAVITSQFNLSELNTANGAITLEAVATNQIRQISNIGNLGVLSEYGENTGITTGQSTTSTTFVDVTGSSFTLPSAGTWLVNYNTSSYNNSAGTYTHFKLVTSANVDVPNSSIMTAQPTSAANTFFPGSQSVLITTTGLATYKLQWAVSANTAILRNTFTTNPVTVQGGHTKIIWKKIAGYLPISGQISDYMYAGGTVNQTQVNAPDHIQFNLIRQSSGSSITLDTVTAYTTTANVASIGRFTLQAGKTYRLLGTPGTWISSIQSYLAVQWYNADTNTPINGNSGVAFNISGSYTNNNGFSAGSAETIFTPTVNTRVELRTVNQAGVTNLSASDANGGPTASIIQIGTSPVSAFTKVQIQGNVSGASLPNGSNFQLTLTPTLQIGATLAGNNFIAPRDGYYNINYGASGNWTWTLNGFWLPNVIIAGTGYNGNITAVPTGASYYTGCSFSRTLRILAGQTLSLNVIQASGQTGNVGGNSDTFSITEI